MSALLPEQVFAGVHHLPGAAWLDGGAGGRWSVLAWGPVDTVTRCDDWRTVGRQLSGAGTADASVPFSGGCLGYIGYGAGHQVESVPPEAPTPEPALALSAYDGALCFDHVGQTWHAAGRPSARKHLLDQLDATSRSPLAVPPPALSAVTTTTSRRAYEAGVARALAWISAGDCYQINLTRPVKVAPVDDPWSVYRRLRARSPAPYGAFLRVARDLAILSNSPERFLSASGSSLTSSPIKGTRPRGQSETEDRALAHALASSAKDCAELTMIVDLVRNDLGRVARPGSVRVGERRVLPHANVHHAVWDVFAELATERDAWDALGACFPPGSVTGAPKVRACQRIAELETTPRGVYCGAIGYVSTAAIADWSVAIRTAVWHGGEARYHVGGGIVADSTPTDEWEETVAKGTVLAAALSTPSPASPR